VQRSPDCVDAVNIPGLDFVRADDQDVRSLAIEGGMALARMIQSRGCDLVIRALLRAFRRRHAMKMNDFSRFAIVYDRQPIRRNRRRPGRGVGQMCFHRRTFPFAKEISITSNEEIAHSPEEEIDKDV
jgi:hypothetical protein